MNFLRNFMNGRYGSDNLNFFMIFAYLIVGILTTVTGLKILNVLCFAIIILTFYRMFSKNIDKRRRENAKFEQILWELRHGFSGRSQKRQEKKNARVSKKAMRQDKEHKYFKCKNCGAISRVPRGKGRIEITCPRCKNKIIGKS